MSVTRQVAPIKVGLLNDFVLGTRISFGKWTRRGWMGAGYLVARTLDPDGVTHHLAGRDGD